MLYLQRLFEKSSNLPQSFPVMKMLYLPRPKRALLTLFGGYLLTLLGGLLLTLLELALQEKRLVSHVTTVVQSVSLKEPRCHGNHQ